MLIDLAKMAKIHKFGLANSLLDSPMATCMANPNENPDTVVFLWVVWLSSDIQRVPVWLVSLDVVSSDGRANWGAVFGGAPFFNFGFGVQFNVGDFLRPTGVRLGFSWDVFFGKCWLYFPVFWWGSIAHCCRGIHLQHTLKVLILIALLIFLL